MTSATTSVRVEDMLCEHTEMLFSVAMQLTRTCWKAERLTRITLCQVLHAPELLEDVQYPKPVLLSLLRNNFIQYQREQLFMKVRKHWMDGSVTVGESIGMGVHLNELTN